MVLEIGYNEIIEGQKVYKTSENGKVTKCYSAWSNMLQRCYNPKFQEKNPNWIGWTVAEEWLNYQVFAKWFNDNYYEIEGEKVVFDKDLFGGDSKIYSADTCCFVPKIINTALIEGKGYYFDKSTGKYQAHIKYKGKKIHLGLFETIDEAYEAYRLNKQLIIYLLAEDYKEYLPLRVYEALMDYRMDDELDIVDEVDIDDDVDDTIDVDVDNVDDTIDIDELIIDEQLMKILVAIKNRILDRVNHMNTTELLNEMASYSSALDDDCNENRDIHKLYISFLNGKLQRKLG